MGSSDFVMLCTNFCASSDKALSPVIPKVRLKRCACCGCRLK
ncbi:Uncharacterised protein [Vibrio cholerae]|nr:Uncharacterised protein [Vibrio cholerae]